MIFGFQTSMFDLSLSRFLDIDVSIYRCPMLRNLNDDVSKERLVVFERAYSLFRTTRFSKIRVSYPRFDCPSFFEVSILLHSIYRVSSLPFFDVCTSMLRMLEVSVVELRVSDVEVACLT